MKELKLDGIWKYPKTKLLLNLIYAEKLKDIALDP